MARSSQEINDPSRLDSPHVDLAARTGWLVRTSRLHRPEGSRLLTDLADELGVSPGTLSRWETGRVPLTPVHLERLETVLPAAAGSIRGLVALLRHQLLGRGARSARRGPARPSPGGGPDLASTSAQVRAVFEGGARGLDWMHLADAVDEGRLLVPWPLMEPVLASLISEHARSVVCGYFTREEALLRLVQGPYGPRLQAILIETALAPDTQARVDTLGSAGQRPTPEVFSLMCRLLADERDEVFRGAAWALECMFRQGGLAVRPLLPHLERALAGLPDERRSTGFELLASLPAGIRRTLGPALGTPPAPQGLAALPAPARRAVAREVMTGVAEQLDTAPDPMLERLALESLFDAYWSKRLFARFLMMAPPYAHVVGDCVVRALDGVERVDQNPMGTAALDFVSSVGSPQGMALVTAWARDRRSSTRRRGLVALAHFGSDLDADLLTEAVQVGGATTTSALYAAGMTGNPLLAYWAADETASPEVREGAAWWLRHGSRLAE